MADGLELGEAVREGSVEQEPAGGVVRALGGQSSGHVAARDDRDPELQRWCEETGAPAPAPQPVPAPAPTP